MATVIQIKRSPLNAEPLETDLAESEMAYAQDKANDGADAKLYIESLDSTDTKVVHAVGGYHYTKRIDEATSAATPSKLVERDSSGDIAANIVTAALSGNATSATAFQTPQTITFEDGTDENGDPILSDVRGSVTFDGSGAVSVALDVVGAEANQVTGNVLANGGQTVVENGTDGTDAFLIGDVRATNGTSTILDSGTDGTNAIFTGSVNGNVTGDLTGDVYSDDGLVKVLENSADGSNATFTGDVIGNADTATDAAGLSSAVTVGLSGDATGSATFEDAGDTATIAMTLASQAGVVANAYGSTTAVPVVTVNEKGLVTAISTQAIATNLNIAGDTGTDEVAGGEELTFAGTANEIETTVTDNQVQIGLPTNVDVGGTLGVGGKLTVTGDLEVNGALTTVNSTDLEVTDGLIRLGKGNTADSLDLGFVSQFNDGLAKYSGFFRDTNDDKYHIFDTQQDLATAQTVDKGDSTYEVSTLVANLESGTMQIANGGLTGGTISSLDTDLAVADGGTGASTFTSNGVILGNGAGALVATAAGQSGQVLTVDPNTGAPTFSGIDGGSF